MAKIYKSPIIAVEKLTSEIVRLRFLAPEIAKAAHSGHFINVLVADRLRTLWRRPFSIHRVDRQADWAEILFEVVGPGTELLAQARVAQKLDFIGPLGQAFVVPDGCNSAVLVAGGLGIAPMILLAQDLISAKIPVQLFYGAQNQSRLCCLDDLNAMAIPSHLSTDDGSHGDKGLVTDALKAYIQHQDLKRSAIFACGPMPMLAAIQTLCLEYGLTGQASVETLMACGFGACMGCNVKTRDKQKPAYVLACKDGPVFPITEIQFYG